MNLNKQKWTKEDYQEYLKMLKELANPKYRDFHSKLTKTKYQILGIPVPVMRKISKDIQKGNILSFLNLTTDTYYEEVMIMGLVIASMKEEIFWEYLEKFLPKIDNWAICDGFCNSIQFLKKNENPYFSKILELLKEEEPFTIRVGLIILLSFYIKESYLEEIFNNINQITSKHYYVNMATSWLLAEMYIKYPDKTEKFFKQNQLNDFTMNKTISKIRDSYRVTKEKKEELLKYKRRKKK